ncbi:MAG: alpha/beta hydrolase [Prevotellaceae bacterium]|jgi:acetyl esterase/lipase|nr:alpha/beta hydrolase [Prevotellaceae bacterium]
MRKIKFLVYFIICITHSLYARKTIQIWDKEGRTAKERLSELTVFLPEKPDTSGISVIICPGGSYYWLDMSNEGFSVARYLNRKGISAFVLSYRTSQHGSRHPAMIRDLQRSIQLVKENADKYGINPEKLGVMGFSAGGHLAGTAAIYFDANFLDTKTSTSLKPYFVAMIYPVVSMEDSICHKKSRKNLLGKKHTAETAKMMSLEQNVRPDMPPVFLLHCTGDKTVDCRNSVAMDEALTNKGVKHRFLLLDEKKRGGHGFGIRPAGKATGWIDEFLKWIYTI